MGGCPVAASAANAKDEVTQQLRSMWGVVHFWMKLDCPDSSLFIGDGGQGVKALGGEVKAAGELEGFITVAHPDLHFCRQAFEERGPGVFHDNLGVAVLASVG